MKQITYFIFIGIFFTSCSHRIVRTDYNVNKSDYKNCDVIIKRNTNIKDTLITKIGEIKLGESGFSTACSEEHAIKILKKEACAISANLIIITEENRPDLWSSCYRCRADFYKYNDTIKRESSANDKIYQPEKVKQRVSKDRKNNTVVFIGSVIAGVLIGLLLI
ncbi:hypothetical protein KO493_11020 [Tamlana agarivorans]|uniref:Uncharacterized protein n=1 Tax=Pseudotamlana agarivorans TaxID=481183 RepID=A0ACC5UAG5_9FLAO|nr:hypothetical protein [Tamlana agarivorans]MBU2951229.1 hypothetical protein [Tamlana agarivorans]